MAPIIRSYTDSVVVLEEKVEEIADNILKVIKNELLEEAHLYCVYKNILEEAKSKLNDSVVVI